MGPVRRGFRLIFQWGSIRWPKDAPCIIMEAMSTKTSFSKTRLGNRPRQTAAARPPTPTGHERRQPTHDDVARRAKALWERYGKPVGRDEEIWLEAEREARRIVEPDPTNASRAPLKGDPKEIERAVDRIQEMGDTPRGTQQVIR